MTPTQKIILKNWIYTGIFLLVATSTFLLPQEHRLSAGIATGVLLALMPILNPGLRNWKGYGPRGVRLGEYLQAHGLLQLWLVIVCTFVLPVLIYQIYSSGGDAWGLYALCFALLICPPIITSEVERYRHAGLPD
ncbi:hypothetical protein [Marinobacter sp.]|uniref:hypothetical protein n=1 Tax=Marinobacter sp. TaxID=50741 RepID=UPI0034A112C5